MNSRTDTHLVLRALILLGVVVCGFVVATDQGLVSLALNSDKSYISYVILGLYGLASAHWLWLALVLTRERRQFALLQESLDTPGAELQPVDPSGGLVDGFLANLLAKTDQDASALVAAFGDELLNRHALGHFTSDLLLKLGLLGTVVGFIFMLLPVAEIQDFDPSLIRDLLAAMSSGMAVALYTTLAGLVTSTLLRLQYHVLDSSAVDLATRLAVLVDVRLKVHAA